MCENIYFISDTFDETEEQYRDYMTAEFLEHKEILKSGYCFVIAKDMNIGRVVFYSKRIISDDEKFIIELDVVETFRSITDVIEKINGVINLYIADVYKTDNLER